MFDSLCACFCLLALCFFYLLAFFCRRFVKFKAAESFFDIATLACDLFLLLRVNVKGNIFSLLSSFVNVWIKSEETQER